MAPNEYIIDGVRVSVDKYNKQKYDDLRLRVTKGKKDIIKSHADQQKESVNAFINRAIDETIQRDKEKDQR